MATNFGTEIAITSLWSWMIATRQSRQLVIEGLSGRRTECRYCWYSAHKGRCYGSHFLLSTCGVHIGNTWRIRLNRPCVAAMRPYVKLLWTLVKTSLRYRTFQISIILCCLGYSPSPGCVPSVKQQCVIRDVIRSLPTSFSGPGRAVGRVCVCVSVWLWVMSNVMAALPNIGGALCSTPQFVCDAHYSSAVQ